MTIIARTNCVKRSLAACKIIERGSGEVAGNIQSMRARLLDSECGITESSKALLGAAFKEVVLKISPTGETRIEKRDSASKQG